MRTMIQSQTQLSLHGLVHTSITIVGAFGILSSNPIHIVINESPMMGKTRTTPMMRSTIILTFFFNTIWALRCNGAELTILSFHSNSRKLTLKQRYSDATSIIIS